MIIKVNAIKATTISGIMSELRTNPDIMDVIAGHNLRGGDAIEAMASDLYETGEDIDTDDYLHIC
jgi:hypothetical protein